MSRIFLALLIIIVYFNASAQELEISVYLDALKFNGRVSHVKMNSVATDGRKANQVEIDYDYEGDTRTVRTYAGEKELQNITEMLTKNPKDDKVIKYVHELNKLYIERYTYDVSGSKIVSGQHVLEGEYKTTLTYNNKGQIVNAVVCDNNDAIKRILKYTYSKGNKDVDVIHTDPMGRVIMKVHRKLDARNNPIQIDSEDFKTNEKNTIKYKYTYDSHGNYTSFTTTSNGQPAYSHYREITYGK